MAKGDHETNDTFIEKGLIAFFTFPLGPLSHDVLDFEDGDYHVFSDTKGVEVMRFNMEIGERLRAEGARYELKFLWKQYEYANDASSVTRMNELITLIHEIAEDFNINASHYRGKLP